MRAKRTESIEGSLNLSASRTSKGNDLNQSAGSAEKGGKRRRLGRGRDSIQGGIPRKSGL